MRSICSNADTGKPIGNASGSTCPTIASGSGSGSGCVNIGDVSNGRKNALQADPTAAGNNGSFVVNRAYLGDIDGKYWRFTFTSAGNMSALSMIGHEPADLRIVGAAVRRQHGRLHVLCDGQRPAAGDCPGWNRHLQALWVEGQLSVSGRRAVHARPCHCNERRAVWPTASARPPRRPSRATSCSTRRPSKPRARRAQTSRRSCTR